MQTMTAFTTAGNDDEYAADIEQFATADLKQKTNEEIKTRFIQDYVEADGLVVTAYRDYGWDPVPVK